MESQYNQPHGQSSFQRPLPNATAVLILGIVSIVTCICYGAPSLICSIIALILAGKDRNLYRSSPGAYTTGSYNNLNAGRVCAIIGLVLSILYIGAIIVGFAIFGTQLTDPEFLKSLQNMK